MLNIKNQINVIVLAFVFKNITILVIKSVDKTAEFTSKKLVFLIDELDRCRPTYAVETIEKIKHLFSVPGIIWVLVMNKEQIESSIQKVYGTINSKE